ncbi:hypothetical protein BLNAU_11241 [Blattamonas nauphoetae]|uniref:Serine-threonine/tyrosine-protein kinase catalytic domain-containing protein n=1 Tax=Blattamonas nauphoetae TaxID=2049346 RepID=A0ABQ9XR21_9EUKA|nr:hypothetical protein BLNAU_11241 [Blattamonas nauphoetae]
MFLLWINLSTLSSCRDGATLSPSDYHPTLLPLSEALRNQQFSIENEAKNEVNKFELAEGSFHTDGHHIVSQKVEIEGRNTMIVHSNQSPQFSSTNNEQGNPSISIQKSHPSIFIVMNSSLTLKNLILSVWKGGLVCFVDSSDVGLVGCRIGSSVECSPLVVSSPTLSRSTTITMIGCCHSSSESWVVHPFVGVDRNILPNDHSLTTVKQSDQLSEGSISVIGCDLSFSTWLFGRSRPLLEMNTNTTNEFRCPDGQPNEEICTTTLVSSSFVNVSSLSLGSGIPTNRPRLTQKVIGCSMLRSTDHFRGTALRDMNMGGNVLCSNSSFAHCSSASNEDINQGGRIVFYQTVASTQTFTSCTFRHMTCTSTEHVGGAAISLDRTLACVTISLCAFHDCNATDKSADGGAVCFWGTGETANPASTITISQSSFTDCSTADGGGAVNVYFIQSLSLDDCFFWGNSAHIGGALAHQSMRSSTISNSSFEENQATYGGGAVHFNNAVPFLLTDLLFRINFVTRVSGGSDISFYALQSSNVPEANITRCDTTSPKPAIWFSGDGSTDSTRLYPVTLGFAILSYSVSHSETESTVTITTVNAVSGVMSVLLSGGLVPRLVFVSFGSTGSTTGTGTTTTDVLPSSNEYTLEAAALAGFKLDSSIVGAVASLINPNTARIELTGTKLGSGSYSMLVKDASGKQTNMSLTLSSSTELSTSVSLYPITSAELKYGTNYTVTSVKRDTTSVLVRDGLSFTTPDEPARIVGIWVELDVSGNTTLVTVRGRQIAKGSYTVRLNSESGPWFDISFLDGVRDERNSSVSSVSIFGESPILLFDTAYSLFSVTPTSSPSTPLLIDANPNSFLISEPSRITGVTIRDFSDALKTEATLTMTGRALKPNTDYVMHVAGHPISASLMGANTEPDKRTITIRSDSSDPSGTGSKTIKFYPLPSAELLFGYEYIVDSVSLDGHTLLQNSDLSFSTPIEPARLLSIKTCSLTDSKDGLIVIVKGLALKQTSTLMIVESSDGDEIESDGEIDVKSESECWITFKVDWEENTTHLEFLKTYTLVGGRGGSSELIITPELSFTVPSGPIVQSISAPLDCASSSFSVGIVGTGLPIETGFKVELDGGLSFLVDFSSSTEGNGTISASLPGEMQFDAWYSVASVTKGGRKMKCESVSFKTPVGPTLVDVKASLSTSTVNNVMLTLESVRMPVGAMSLTIKESESTPIVMEVSFVSSEAGSVEVVVFGGSTLKYGTLYTVVSLRSSSLHSSLDGSITFETPAAPPRIKTASCSLVGALQRSGDIVLTGEALPAGESFSMSLDEIDENGDVIAGTTPITLSDRFDGVIGDAGLTTHTLSIDLFPVPQLMKYSSRYRITSLTISTVPTVRTAVEETATFEVPAEPARIVGIWVELDSSGNMTLVTLRGRQIGTGSYTVRLNSESGPSFSISFWDGVSDERNSSVASVSIFGDSPILSFGMIYTLFSVTPTSLPSTPLLIDANPNTFMISEPSRITDVTIGDFSDALKTEATLTKTGRELEPNTDYVMHVTGQPKSPSLMGANTEPDKRTITIRSDSSDPSETGSKTINFYPHSSAELLFGCEYIVDCVTLDGSSLLQNSGLSFSTPEEPSRLVSISPVLAASLETVTLTFGGRCFDVGDFTVNLQVTSPTPGTPFEVACSTVSETELTLTLPISTSDLSSVEFGDVLSVLSLKNDSSSAILEMSTFSIPHPPRVDTASFSFWSDLNTTFSVTLRGTDLPSNERFLVVLDSDYSFEIVITNSSSGTSTEMAIGWTDSLQYDTEYRIVSIRNEETGRNVFVDSSVTFTTEKRPNQIVVFFDSSSSDSSRLCGKKDEPCSSMDSAWKIASNVGASDVSLRLILNATLSSPIVCLSNGIVVVEKGTSTEPTLTIPSSISMGEKGMISVSSGLFEIRDVDVVIESIVPSFVLLSAIDSTIVLRDGSIVGVKTRNESNSDEVLCEWETGILQLSNCTTNITDTVLSHLLQGAINMKGGSLSIVSSTIFDNSPDISSFPSFRQNIRCSESGEIEIGSLHGGDGTLDFPSAWILATDCEVGGAALRQSSPFFISTLSPISTSSFNKKDKTFTLEMIGTTLIPCDLFLEVFEVSKQKTIGKAERMKLDLDTTTSFTESSISLTLSQSSLSSLDSSLEWRGRLIFGENQRSGDSFLIQTNSKERLAQSVKENMKWWLPVAIVLGSSLILLIVIVFFCWRRRKQVPSKYADQPEELEDAEIIVKMEERDEMIGQSVVATSVRAMKDKTITAHGPEIHGQTEVTGNEASDGWDGGREIEVIEVMDCVQFEHHLVSRQNSLYHRLHVENRPLTNKRIQERHLVSALAKLKGMNGNAEVFIHLSTHWLKMTTEGEICLLLEDSKGVETDRMEGEVPRAQERKVDGEREKLDGQRWSAPEQFLEEGEAEKAIKPAQVSVFRLGLVLWEIETGQIPFGETDAVNTCRQLKAGIVPAMDGVSSLSMRDLITRCLSVDGDSRPTLESVLSTLNAIEEDATTWKDTLHF